MPVYIPTGRNRYTTVFRHVSNDESQHIPLVAATGLKPTTSSAQTKRSIKLNYAAIYHYTNLKIL